MLSGHEGDVFDACFSPDSLHVLSVARDDTVRLWPVYPGQGVTQKFVPPWENLDMCWCPGKDGTPLVFRTQPLNVSATQKYFGPLWVLTDQWKAAKIEEHKGPPAKVPFNLHGLSLSPDGSKAAATYLDLSKMESEIRVLDTATGKEVLSLAGTAPHCRCVLFSPDGKQLLLSPDYWYLGLGESEKGKVLVVDAQTGKTLKSLYTVKALGTIARWAPDGRTVFIREHGETAFLVDMESGKKLVTFPESLPDHAFFALFSPDGKRLLESTPNLVRVWDTATGKKLAEWSNTSLFWGNTEHARLWIMQTGENHRLAAFSPDGKHVVTAGGPGGANTATVWEADTGKVLYILRGHKLTVLGVAFSPDGQRIVTGGQDQTARIWDVATGKEFLTLPHEWPVLVAAFVPDGTRVQTIEFDYFNGIHSARVWPADPLPLALAVQTRPLTKDERELYETGPAPALSVKPGKLMPRPFSPFDQCQEHLHRVKAFAHAGLIQAAMGEMKALSQTIPLVFLGDDYHKILNEATYIRLVLLNDLAGYRQDCTQSADRFQFEGFVWFCCLGPDAVPDLDGLLQKVESKWNSAKDKKDPDILNTLGALQYRAGKFSQAIDTLKKAATFREDKKPIAEDLVFLALAHHALGQTKEAKETLDQAEKLFHQASYLGVIELQMIILLHEAETKIRTKKAGAG